MLDPRLLTLPALVALAEANARTQYEAEAAMAREQGLGDAPDVPGDWAWLAKLYPRMSSIRVAAHLALLSDLSRPASRWAVASLIAATRPNWQTWEIVAAVECGGSRLAAVRMSLGLDVERWEPDRSAEEEMGRIALAVLGAPRE